VLTAQIEDKQAIFLFSFFSLNFKFTFFFQALKLFFCFLALIFFIKTFLHVFISFKTLLILFPKKEIKRYI